MDYTKAFKSLLRDATKRNSREKFLAEVPYRRSVHLVKALPEGMEPLAADESLFVITDSAPDREGDVILSSGMDVEAYANHGFMLFGHDANNAENMIGHPAEVIKEANRILMRAKFFSADVNPRADMIHRMLKAAGRGSTSVGIMINEYTEANDRAGWMPLNILRSELAEVSVVPVPANPRAVALALGEEEKTDAVEVLTQTADDAVGFDADAIRSLVKETVDLILSKQVVYSVSAQHSDPANEALLQLARFTAQ